MARITSKHLPHVLTDYGILTESSWLSAPDTWENFTGTSDVIQKSAGAFKQGDYPIQVGVDLVGEARLLSEAHAAPLCAL